MLHNIYYWLKKKYKLTRFKKNASLGKNFNCSYGASCCNLSRKACRISIADNCEIDGSISVDETGIICIGEFTTIRYSSSIESTERITIDDHVIISNNVIIRDNNSHPTDVKKRHEMSESGFGSDLWKWKYAKSAPIHIESNVWIGERAIIYKGVTIGKGSIIAGGSVVTKSIPEYCVAAGNPAKIVKYLTKNEQQ